MKKEVKLYKTTSVSFATEPDAVFFVKGVNETVVRTYITTSDGQAIPLKDLSGTGGITNITSTDSSITITGLGTNKNIQVSSALQTLINSALQSGDLISTLINDAGYITLADVPTFNPSDYDLSDFTNSSSDPFVKQSEITSGATNLGYTASPTNGIVTSDTGSDATIPLADSTNAGLLSPAEKSEIATAIQPSDLGTVATSNDYNDLDNLPTPLTNHSELNLDDGTNPHGTTKTDVGLDNVDNTSDIDKPISTATQNALNLKANAKWEGIDDVDSGSGVTGVTIETLDKTYHILPNVLQNGHLDFSIYSIRETGSSLAHIVIVRANNVNNFATATEIFRSTTSGNFNPHLRAQRKFVLKNNLIRDAALGNNTNVGSSPTGISVPFNLSGDLYIFLSVIPGATNQVIKFDGVQIKQL